MVWGLSLVWAGSSLAHAQTVQWVTNYYSVQGDSFRDIRRSIAQARPWRDGFDADTRWEVTWNYRLAGNAEGCRVTSASTVTKITTTMPRWTSATNASLEMKQHWTRYYTNLLQHEAGHGRLALAAAAEVRRALENMGAHGSCQELRQAIATRANAVLADYRRREEEYDRQTNHGRTIELPRRRPPSL